MKNYIFALLTVCLIPQASLATSYEEILTKNQLQGTGGSKACYGSIIVGTTSYNFMNLTGDSKNSSDSGRVTVTTGLDTATPVTTELLSSADWQAAINGASTNLAGYYGVSYYDNNGNGYLQFSETSSDSVWQLYIADGTLTQVISGSQIASHTGQSSTQLLAYYDTGLDGTWYGYEGKSDSFLHVTSNGTLETYITKAELNTLTGDYSTSISGGITFDGSSRMIFGNSGSDSIYAWDESQPAGSEGSVLLSLADIIAVTGETSSSFGDIYYAPDGMVYFYERSSWSIMRFDPTDAAATLEYVLTQGELEAGPMVTTSSSLTNACAQFSWYGDDMLVWTPVSTYITPGLFGVTVASVPEPSTAILLFLSLASLAFRRTYRS